MGQELMLPQRVPSSVGRKRSRCLLPLLCYSTSLFHSVISRSPHPWAWNPGPRAFWASVLPLGWALSLPVGVQQYPMCSLFHQSVSVGQRHGWSSEGRILTSFISALLCFKPFISPALESPLKMSLVSVGAPVD